ncbi:MAG: 50S ribosomal protein L25 [Blastocatellia bacterium]|nr:50S ribosomal protein L25 [Blastocatellia bacterium]MBL8195660.1 50S ribosomal protein L25 [Blastocatellia bacterium]MBN8723947.1 50S ribosomal protein L25 [Acidobacteriota bacterium]
MISDITVEASLRNNTGSAESRRLRRVGLMPATIYGDKKDPLSVIVNAKEITRILRSESGHNTIFNLQTPGHDATTVRIKDWQIHPISGKLMHADFYRISLTEKQNVNVPVELVGEAAGTKIGGGILEHNLRELSVECLAADIPEHISVDVSNLQLGEHISVKDISVPEGLRVLNNPDQVVASVLAPREETVSEPLAEPEVIKKGKEEK